jgi:hypothetical protein
MDDKRSGPSGPPEGSGYDTPGRDTIIESTSPAVPSPSRTAEERLTTPKSYISSIDEQPGDANPALAETVGEEQGKLTTAEMLRARETAEEQPVEAAGIRPYQDEGASVTADEFEDKDTGRPNWPNDRQEDPLEYMESPRGDMPLLSGAPDVFSPELKGRVDAAIDRAGTQASANETRSGLPPVGSDAQEDIYEHREFGRPTEQSEMDRMAPGMLNIPPDEDEDEQ